jgi:hypothetical protein
MERGAVRWVNEPQESLASTPPARTVPRCTDALVMQALMAVGTTQARLEFLG